MVKIWLEELQNLFSCTVNKEGATFSLSLSSVLFSILIDRLRLHYTCKCPNMQSVKIYVTPTLAFCRNNSFMLFRWLVLTPDNWTSSLRAESFTLQNINSMLIVHFEFSTAIKSPSFSPFPPLPLLSPSCPLSHIYYKLVMHNI